MTYFFQEPINLATLSQFIPASPFSSFFFQHPSENSQMPLPQEELPAPPPTRWHGGITLTGLMPKSPNRSKHEKPYPRHASTQGSAEAYGIRNSLRNRGVRVTPDLKATRAQMGLDDSASEFAEWSSGETEFGENVNELVHETTREISEEASSLDSDFNSSSSISSSPPTIFTDIFSSSETHFSPSMSSDLELNPIDFDFEKFTGVSEKETISLIGYGFPELIPGIPSIDTENIFNLQGDQLTSNEEEHTSTSSIDADDERSSSLPIESESEAYAASRKKFSRKPKSFSRKRSNEKNLKIDASSSSSIHSSSSWPISPVRIKTRKIQDPSLALLDSLPSNTNSALSIAAMTQLALEDAYDLRLYIDYSRNLTLKALQAYSNAVLNNEEYNGPITMVAAARIVIRESPRGMLELREITSELARRWPTKFARVNKGTLSTNTIRHALSFNKTFGNVSVGKKKNVWYVRPGMPVTNEKNLK